MKNLKFSSSLLFVLGCSALSWAAFADGSSPTPNPSATPVTQAPGVNDPFFARQWALKNDGTQTVMIEVDALHTVQQTGVAGMDIGWEDAQSEVSTLATHPVTVAVIDSGIDPGHPDLIGRIATGGFDFLTNFPIVPDPYGHGTHVSGIIAANANNGIGVAGVAPPSVSVLPLRVLWPDGDPHAQTFTYMDPKSPDPSHPNFKLISDYTADAVRYATAHGASVINLSLGWPKIVDTANAQQAFQDAVKAGVLIVVSAGNDKKEQTTYPCAYEGVLCVGAISNTGALSIFSNFGGTVDVLAPGDGILSTYSRQVESQILRINGYELLSGTSQAAPYVAGIAATLKSAYPQMTLDELKARVLVSAGALPSANSSLYGLVNLKRALDAQPQPVYLPDFKQIDAVSVDETTLTAQGQISVRNLWQTAQNVEAQVLVNGVQAGTLSLATLATGASFSIPWSYKFTSLDDSSAIHISVQISDSSMKATGLAPRDFILDTIGVRAMENIKGNPPITVTGVNSSDWMVSNNGHPFSRVSQVDSYPPEAGLPRYFQELLGDASGCVLELFDPTSATPVSRIKIPGIQYIKQVIHMDLNADGTRDWVVIGYDQLPGSTTPNQYWEFYFMDSKFQPFFGGNAAASAWQVPNPGMQTAAERNYAQPGSWVQGNGQLLPSFLAQGNLPVQDDFPELDPRRGASAMHFYYLVPSSAPVGAPATTGVQLVLKALDNATFRSTYPSAILQNILPSSVAEQIVGHDRIMISMGSDLSAKTVILDLKSIEGVDFSKQMAPAPDWSFIDTAAFADTTFDLNSSVTTTGFLSFFDTSHGSLTWTDSNGQVMSRSEFSYQSPEDKVLSLKGTFDLGSEGKYWFLETVFNLAGYKGDQMATLPIERDSSFPGQEFSQMLTPVLVGNAAAPRPGVYVDSTLVRGNQVAVATWDADQKGLIKPLRYSLLIPDGCLQMSPVQFTDGAESFALPLICAGSTGGVQVLVVKP